MALVFRSTVTWRGPTVEEREAGWGWLMSTWHNLVLPAHKDWPFNGRLYCGRFSSGRGCVSAAINTSFSYQQVCGRVAGYEKDGPDGFRPFNEHNLTINQVYFEGLSIVYGTPRWHIWTYAAGFSEKSVQIFDCPCNDGSKFKIPPYVGDDYYCESGNGLGDCSTFHNSDPLWDGQQCGGVEAPCCTHPNMRGSSRHSMRPPLRTLNWERAQQMKAVPVLFPYSWLSFIYDKNYMFAACSLSHFAALYFLLYIFLMCTMYMYENILVLHVVSIHLYAVHD